MVLKFLGAAKTITGACYLLQTLNTKILIDCGLFQGGPSSESKNYESFGFDPASIDYVLITHSHIDHIGRLPKLVKEGFSGEIWGTQPSRDLAQILLSNSVHVLEEKAKLYEREPLFEAKDISQTMELWKGVDYNQGVRLGPNIMVRFKDAGHILGSAIVEVSIRESKKITKLVFSGDLGNYPIPLLNPPHLVKEADYVIMESAYGDRLHQDKKQKKAILEDAVEDTVAKNGTLMVPAFAIERTQEILYELNNLVEHYRIPRIPIYIDSPLAIEAIPIYKKYPQYYNQETTYLIESGNDLFKFPGLIFTRTKAQSKKIMERKPPKVIIAGSGMSTGGRILYHETHYLPDPNSCFLSTCYQVKGTLGREILDGAKAVNIFGRKIPVRCRVRVIEGYSAHADQKGLLRWLRRIKKPVKKIFVVQGEPNASQVLATKIEDRLGIEAIIPEPDQQFSI